MSNQKFIDELDLMLLERRVYNTRGINEIHLQDALNKRQEINDYKHSLEGMRDWLELDFLLLQAEISVGLMDGLPLPGAKECVK